MFARGQATSHWFQRQSSGGLPPATWGRSLLLLLALLHSHYFHRSQQPRWQQRSIGFVERLRRVRVGLRRILLLIADQPVHPEVRHLHLNQVGAWPERRSA